MSKIYEMPIAREHVFHTVTINLPFNAVLLENAIYNQEKKEASSKAMDDNGVVFTLFVRGTYAKTISKYMTSGKNIRLNEWVLDNGRVFAKQISFNDA